MCSVWPNLFIPGAAKSGTTTLHYYLNQHPDIWMSPDKETDFFSDEDRYVSGKKYYLSLFKNGKDCRYRGESSTGYMAHPKALIRIKKDTIDPKFIFILRNPIDRAFSNYNWLVGNGVEHRPFEQAFLSNIHQEIYFSSSEPHYYLGSCYGKWLSRYYEVFGAENIHIITSEDLTKYPLGTINTCFKFLHLSAIYQIQKIQLNKTVILKNPAFYRNSMILMSKQGDNWMKIIYRKLVPDLARIKIRKTLVNFLEYAKYNYAESSEPSQLSNTQRVWLTKYFSKDVSLLKEITGRKFPQWSDFE